jgi:hypothetical protein
MPPFPIHLHVEDRNCFKNQAEYKKFETQAFTKVLTAFVTFIA